MTNNIPKYSEYIVTFIDIMGFKHLVETRYEGNAAPIVEIIESFVSTNTVCGRIITSGGFEKEVKSHFFSDSIVRRIRVGDKSDEHIMRTLNFEILQLALLQIYLIEQGVFIRGCINMGQMYGSKDSFFGKAFNDAYYYESSVAHNPLIVLSNEVFEFITTKQSQSSLEVLSLFANPEMHYNHGQPYISYLRMLVTSTLGMSPDQSVAFMRAHKKYIEEELSLHQSNVPVFMKYLWLKEYHNHYVLQLPAFTDRNKLVIQ
jgi:hypothetical protein